MGCSSVVERLPCVDNALIVLQPSVSLTKGEVTRKTACAKDSHLLPVGLCFGSTYLSDLQYPFCPIKTETSCERRSVCPFIATNHSVLRVVFWASSRELVPDFYFELQAQANGEHTCEYWCRKDAEGALQKAGSWCTLKGAAAKQSMKKCPPTDDLFNLVFNISKELEGLCLFQNQEDF